MKKAAVIVDAGFLRVKIKQSVRAAHRAANIPIQHGNGSFLRVDELLTATEYVTRVCNFARGCIAADEELYRIFYYDCPPYVDGASFRKPHPLGIAGVAVPIMEPHEIKFQNDVLTRLRREENFAVRTGEISFDGWALTKTAIDDLIVAPRPLTVADFIPIKHQKGVDLKIGVDVTLLAKDKLVDRIIIIGCDSDLVPCMKVARREGTQVVLMSLGAMVKKLLREHADYYRSGRV